MDQHPNLFGADAETELPALVAPRVTAPVKAAPKAQPIALDLFPEVGLFADQDDAEADQADEDAALADDQGDLADLADALREEAAELPAMREDSLLDTAHDLAATKTERPTMDNTRSSVAKAVRTHLRAKGIRKARVDAGSNGADLQGNATGWAVDVSHHFGKGGSTQAEILAALASFPGFAPEAAEDVCLCGHARHEHTKNGRGCTGCYCRWISGVTLVSEFRVVFHISAPTSGEA